MSDKPMSDAERIDELSVAVAQLAVATMNLGNAVRGLLIIAHQAGVIGGANARVLQDVHARLTEAHEGATGAFKMIVPENDE